jgi:DNA invertase Pin-like site-specific DNA recombinase
MGGEVVPMVRAAIYARVSTRDKDQDPETQLLPLREFVRAQGWAVAGEFVDIASATDMSRRAGWAELVRLASRRAVDVVLVWKLDRAFRSVLDATSTLQRLRGWQVALRSLTEEYVDTTTAAGELVFHILAAVAQMERSQETGEDPRQAQEKRGLSGRPRSPCQSGLLTAAGGAGKTFLFCPGITNPAGQASVGRRPSAPSAIGPIQE